VTKRYIIGRGLEESVGALGGGGRRSQPGCVGESIARVCGSRGDRHLLLQNTKQRAKVAWCNTRRFL
jgi:hypothetical protein